MYVFKPSSLRRIGNRFGLLMSDCLAPLTGVAGLDDSLDVLVHPFPEIM